MAKARSSTRTMTPSPARGGRLASALTLGVLVAGAAAPVLAESSFAQNGGQATASLSFRIVIPSVLVMDSRTGQVYTNDARAVAQLGALDVAGMPAGSRDTWTVMRIAAPKSRGTTTTAGALVHAHGVTGLAGRGAVLCLP